MGTQDSKGKVIPFTPPPAAGRARSETPDPAQLLGTMRDLALARRRGFDTVEHVVPPRHAAAPTVPGSAAAQPSGELDAPRLSALFIASLDDLICQRTASSVAGDWPRQGNRQLDKVAADIVDMLFGFVLDDPQIPHAASESLLAAQLPMLQMAMREPAFFADWQHPARQLLNDIAPLFKEHGERGGDATVFATFFASGMARVLDELAPNGTAFAILHHSLREFVRDTGSRTPDADAWQRAEAAARNFLERPLPPLVRDFVADHWIDVLERTAEHHAENSPQWLDALAVVDDLAWSLTAKTGEEERFRLIALIPALLARLNRGLDLIDVGREDRRPFFDALIDIHSRVLRIETAPAKTPPRAESADEQVARLRRGDWVELRHDDGGVTRERLTWISPQRGILVFSNHHGQGAIQIAPEDLVDRVKTGRATLIFDQPTDASDKNSA